MFKTIASIAMMCTMALGLVACGGSSGGDSAKKATQRNVVLVFGDSISAGYGNSTTGQYFQFVTPGNNWTELLAKTIGESGVAASYPVEVINASIGGEFTTEARQRLPALLAQHKPTHVLLAHGTNDAWSSVDFGYIGGQMQAMAEMVKAAGGKPVIVDITFAGFGTPYGDTYRATMKNAANATGASYVDLLGKAYAQGQYYHADGVHLNDAAQPIMRDNIWAVLKGLII